MTIRDRRAPKELSPSEGAVAAASSVVGRDQRLSAALHQLSAGREIVLLQAWRLTPSPEGLSVGEDLCRVRGILSFGLKAPVEIVRGDAAMEPINCQLYGPRHESRNDRYKLVAAPDLYDATRASARWSAGAGPQVITS